jgi:ElaB/YqjD/DUF883 family membrane-anchored ribosome-binding protein
LLANQSIQCLLYYLTQSNKSADHRCETIAEARVNTIGTTNDEQSRTWNEFWSVLSSSNYRREVEIGDMESEANKLNRETPIEPSRSAGKAATAIKAAAQQFLDDRGINLNIVQAENFVRDKPVVSTGIAAAAGFVVGGGLITRPGVAVLFLFGRKLAGELTTNLALGAIRPSGPA